MKMQDIRKKLRAAGNTRCAWLLVFLLWISAFSLACRLLSMPERQAVIQRGFTGKVLGGIRSEISDGLFEQADLVFHKGVGHAPRVKDANWFARMRRQVAPYGHHHLHEEGIMEIMPWLYFAARADTGNVTAYSVAAYWLAGAAGRPDLAEGVLNEAVRNNPCDYRVYMEKGRLAMKQGQFSKAARFLDAAYSRLPGTLGADKEQKRFDCAEILDYRGLVYEIQESPQDALRCYREILELFPGRLNLKERMVELQKTGRSPVPPAKLVESLLYQHRFVCAHEGKE
jgi:tetratricopeptide (TPR) repeat protein